MAQYDDPANVRLGNGRAMSELMRGGPKGIRGVVVSPSTPGGVPANFNPHDKNNIKINIEPDGPNGSSLMLSDITADMTQTAVDKANSQITGNDINAMRERAAMAFEELAKMANSSVKRVPNKAVPPPVPKATAPSGVAAAMSEAQMLTELEETATTLRAEPPLPPIEKIDRTYSPMAAFGLKKPPPAAATPVVAKSTTSGPPQKLVYFEKEGIGTVPAFFHEVLISVSRPDPEIPEESGFIVLIYDIRFEQSAARWFPPANDPYHRPWAVQINDDRRLYLVNTTGFQYVYDGREYCVLQVEKALRAPVEE